MPASSTTERREAPNDYKRHDPKGWCGNPKYGAALGRTSWHAEDPDRWEGVLYVSAVRIDNEGYDPNGTYFGLGNPIYWVRDATYAIDYVLRAPDRGHALYFARCRYPKASFSRGMSREEWAWLEMRYSRAPEAAFDD